jgi:2-methylcitrate dehydratase PrpD
MNQTELFIEHIYEIIESGRWAEAGDKAESCLLDYTGVTLAGAARNRQGGRHDLTAFLSPGGTAKAIGMDSGASTDYAALVNGINAHTAELDDGHRYAMAHPGAPVISALLAAACERKVSRESLLKGIVAGYEATVRLAENVQPSHKLSGFHASGTCGTVGAAVGVSIMLGFDRALTKEAVSAAAAAASGILEMIEDVSELKPFNVGSAAYNAITAVRLAEAGFKGPMNPLFGRRGFVKAFSDEEPVFRLRDENSLAINEIYVKPYAACRHAHAPVECALTVAERYNVIPDNIEKVTVRTYSLAVDGHDHIEVPSVGAAKMSTPYSVAAALTYRRADEECFTRTAMADPVIRVLTDKVEVIEDKEMTELVPAKRMASIAVEMRDGNTYECTVEHPKGEPENPVTAAELEAKFRSLAAIAGKDEEYMNRVIEAVFDESIETDEILRRI